MKLPLRIAALAVFAALTIGDQVLAMPYKAELAQFQAERDASLKKNWLVVVGLNWLKQDENTVGSGKGSTVPLPAGMPTELAKIYHHGPKGSTTSEIEFTETKGVTVDDRPVQTGQRYLLKSDTSGKPTVVSLKSVSFYLIDRPNGIGVRVKDTDSPLLKTFTGAKWWPANEGARVAGKWMKLPEPRKIKFQDVLGNFNEATMTGYVAFELEGQSLKLYPTTEGDELEFIFRDATSGKESYGAARYLSAAPPNARGEVVLDFNKAYNPPCAYTAFATCPLPPPENILKVAVRAGELKPAGHH